MNLADTFIAEQISGVNISYADIIRFHSKVIYPDDEKKCWGWELSKFKSGYGKFVVNGKLVTCHRFSWTVYFGEIKEGFFVCHKCDNKICSNPNHLFEGTPKDNVQDMISKNRGNYTNLMSGIKNGMAIFTEAQISEIREKYFSASNEKYHRDVSYRSLAREYGCSNVTIGAIIKNRTWKHLIH